MAVNDFPTPNRGALNRWLAFVPGGQEVVIRVERDGERHDVATPRTEAAPELGEVVTVEDGAQQGYTLYSPLHSYHLYLVDMQGKPVRRWTFDRPVWSPYLLDNGESFFDSPILLQAHHSGLVRGSMVIITMGSSSWTSPSPRRHFHRTAVT